MRLVQSCNTIITKSTIMIALVIILLFGFSQAVLADDYGNSIDTAHKFKGKKVKGIIDYKGDEDFFYLRVRKNRTYYIRNAGWTDVVLYLMDAEGNYLGSDNGYNGEASSKLIHVSTSNRIIYIRVAALHPKDTGYYRLKLEVKNTLKSLPAPRADYAAAHDFDTHDTLMFGGAYGATYFDDCWSWDGDDWNYFIGKSTGDGLPAARARHCMVYDQKRGVFILFGGRNHDTVFGDTWELDGNDWRRVSSAGPSAREGATMVWDSDNEVVLLYGGKNEDDYYNDMWQWDGSSWEEVVIENSPSASAKEMYGRAFHGMAYDSNNKIVVVFAGMNDRFRVMDDTWVWDGTSWKEVAAGYWPWRGRRSFGMAYNSDDDHIYVYGGYDGYKRNFDDTRYLSISKYGSTTYYSWDTLWRYNYYGNPQSRSGISMVYDAFRDELIVFGGWNNGSLYNGTWILRNERWYQLK